jgi:hypothetical protein
MNLVDINLQCACLHLAIVCASPAPTVEPAARKPTAEEPCSAANDNEIVWPIMPFPDGWCGSN